MMFYFLGMSSMRFYGVIDVKSELEHDKGDTADVIVTKTLVLMYSAK